MSTFDFPFEANLAAFELVNTIRAGEDGPVDRIADADFAWRWMQELYKHEGLGRINGRGVDRSAVLRQLRKLRTAAKDIADALLADEGVDPEDVRLVNRVLAGAPVRERIVEDEDGFRFEARPASPSVASVLHPIAASLARLLTELDASRVGRCGSDRCVLYYYDVSRNRSRRWCSMERCGNRAKVAAHYERHRST